MSKRTEEIKMSTILPTGVARRLGAAFERRVSLRTWDAANNFFIQTRLIFSRAIVMLVLGLMAVFTWFTIGKKIHDPMAVYIILSFQTFILAILLHMTLWETERVGRTFESLIMRVPSVDRLIWFKLRVSLAWTILLSLPFYLGFIWFVSLPWLRALVYFAFILTNALGVILLTCIVASFVHHGLTSGIVTLILVWITAGFCLGARLPWFDYYRLYVYPYDDSFVRMPLTRALRILIINRVVLLAVVAGFYIWFRHRLARTEKWIA